MSTRTQRFFLWIFIAVVAFQIYVVREWLAGLLLVAVAVAGIAALGAMALILNAVWRWSKTATTAAWETSRAAMGAVAASLAKMGVVRPAFVRSEIVDSKTSREEPVLWVG